MSGNNNFAELVWEKGNILPRCLSTKKSQKDGPWMGCSYNSCSTINRSRVESAYSLFDPSGQTEGCSQDRMRFNSRPDQTREDDILQDYQSVALRDNINVTEFSTALRHKISEGPEHELEHGLDPGWSIKYLSEQYTKSGSQLPGGCVQQLRSCQKQVVVSGLNSSKLQNQQSVAENTRRKGNISFFSRRRVPNKAKSLGSVGASPSSCPPGLLRPVEMTKEGRRSICACSDPVKYTPNGLKSITGIREITNSVTKLEDVLPNTCHLEISFAKKPSAAAGHKLAPKDNESPTKTCGRVSNVPDGTGRSTEPPVASSSVCSSGDSNNPIYKLKRRYEDSYGLTYSSKEVHEESVHMKKAKSARRSQGAQRNQTAEVHNLSERKQRGKLNKKMRALQEIIPNCNKVDSVSTLDEAIEYLKILQLQVQMMSMGNGFYMRPMMLPMGIDPITTPPFLHHGLLGFSCIPAQFLTTPVSGATAQSGIPEGSPPMLGYPSQAVPVYNSPFLTFPSGYPAQ